MQNDPTTAWSSGVPTTGDEFANFLEFNDLDIEFPAFDGQAQQPLAQVAQVPAISDQNGLKQGYDAAAYYEHLRQHALQKGGSIGDLRSRMPGQQQMRPSSHPMQHGYSQMYAQGRIPPTPSSTDLHGGQPHLVVDAHQAMYEAQIRSQQEQMAFTPLGTPAVTPMDTHFQMPEYTVPGEYFSPLASPALHAQSQPAEGQIYYPFQMSDVSETTSPIDVTFEASLKPTTRRQKKRSPGITSKPSPRTVRQSPAMKAQKRKNNSTIIPAKEIQDVLAASARPSTANGSQSLGIPPSMSSESPEPLLDMMPPPAIPSANRSPFIAAGSQSAPMRANAPATPTSLLKMNSAPMRDLSLGEAAMDPEDAPMTDAPTPTLSILPPVPTPVTTSMSPPDSAPTPRRKAKSDFKAPAKGKKRNSSSHPSPALRPKISPSIKPLLPEGLGLINADTSALLLASKSNYQNILDGTHLPGVIYPEALSENLTSKRTSHKIAEQGRRNRINMALQEMASLLPQSTNGASNGSGSGGDAGSGTGTFQSGSKASTVEQAIEYIKSLKTELASTREKLVASEARFKEFKGSTNGSSLNSGTPASAIDESEDGSSKD